MNELLKKEYLLKSVIYSLDFLDYRNLLINKINNRSLFNTFSQVDMTIRTQLVI
jgi:hypothetical protein